MIRYRQGVDRQTGAPLRGIAHLRQSIDVILTTLLGERVMRLDFGFTGHRVIGETMSPAAVLAFYQAVVPPVHRLEPEFRITRLRVLAAGRTGTLQLGYGGTYFPEGRFGNYAVREAADGAFDLSRATA